MLKWDSAWFPAGLILDLETLLECEVDVVTKEALHWYIRDRVLIKAVPLSQLEVADGKNHRH